MCGQVIMIHDNQTYYQNIFFLNSWPQRMTASEEMKMIAKVLQKSLHHAMTIAMLFNGHHYDDYIGNDESDKKVLSRHNAARQLERGWHPLTFHTRSGSVRSNHNDPESWNHNFNCDGSYGQCDCEYVAKPSEFTMDRPLIVRITMMAIMLSHDDDDDDD